LSWGHRFGILRFAASDYSFGILDLRLLITPLVWYLHDLRLLITPLVWYLHDLQLLITPLLWYLHDLRLLITPLLQGFLDGGLLLEEELLNQRFLLVELGSSLWGFCGHRHGLVDRC
jgi:hypothetical protein